MKDLKAHQALVDANRMESEINAELGLAESEVSAIEEN